jgi:hypothetical protein
MGLPRWNLGTGLALLAAIAAGCGKGCSKRGEEEKTIAVEGIEAIPQEVTAIAALRIEKLANSPLVQRAVQQMLLRDPELQKRIHELTQACEFDPSKQLSTVLLGMGAASNDEILVATGHFSPEVQGKLVSCVTRLAAQSGGRLTTTPMATRTTYHFESGKKEEDLYFAFSSETTTVVSSSSQWLEKSLSRAAPAVADPGFKALLARIDQNAALWGVAQVPPAVGKDLVRLTEGKVSAPPRSMAGDLDLQNGLKAQLGIDMVTPADSAAVVTLLQPQLQLLTLFAQKYKAANLVSALKVSAEGETVLLRVVLKDEELRQLVGVVDSDTAGRQDPAPIGSAPEQGATKDEQGDAAPSGKAPVRQ